MREKHSRPPILNTVSFTRATNLSMSNIASRDRTGAWVGCDKWGGHLDAIPEVSASVAGLVAGSCEGRARSPRTAAGVGSHTPVFGGVRAARRSCRGAGHPGRANVPVPRRTLTSAARPACVGAAPASRHSHSELPDPGRGSGLASARCSSPQSVSPASSRRS